jgi:uncharacterized lipoprotein YmbA
MNRASIVTALLAYVLLAACGSSPPVRYFALETIDHEYVRVPADATTIGIGPIRIPDYLRRSQMVTRGQGAELIVDDYNRWAEGLDEVIHRTIASNVDRLLDSVSVVAYPTTALLNLDYRLVGRIDRFDTDARGRAILDTQWGIATPTGEVLVPGRRTRYQAQVSTSGDPAAIARAMSDTIGQFSRDIAREFNAALD